MLLAVLAAVGLAAPGAASAAGPAKWEIELVSEHTPALGLPLPESEMVIRATVCDPLTSSWTGPCIWPDSSALPRNAL